MPKPPNPIPSRVLNVALPLPVFTQMMLHLNSDLEGRVPHGAYSRFISELIREHFAKQTLDIGQLIGPTSSPACSSSKANPQPLNFSEEPSNDRLSRYPGNASKAGRVA